MREFKLFELVIKIAAINDNNSLFLCHTVSITKNPAHRKIRAQGRLCTYIIVFSSICQTSLYPAYPSLSRLYRESASTRACRTNRYLLFVTVSDLLPRRAYSRASEERRYVTASLAWQSQARSLKIE